MQVDVPRHVPRISSRLPRSVAHVPAATSTTAPARSIRAYLLISLTTERALYPTLDRGSRIAGQRIETDSGMGGVRMNHVDQLLEQQEVARDRAYACPDHDAVELLLLELPSENRLGRGAEVMHARLHAVPETGQFLLGGLETGQHLRRGHARRVARLREIDQVRIQTHHENSLAACHDASRSLR